MNYCELFDNLWESENILDEVLLKNIHGTSKERYKKNDGMKQFWLDKSNREWPNKCCVKGCNSKATEGAHMKKAYGTGEWYIVPTCHDHNINYDDFMELDDASNAIKLND